ncbi:MAG: tRNA 5-methylaminomethyl-2-thiouridine biosynthesis bifunctional protein [Pseudomonadota bacterium]|jgi:tRNA 5-methylaminomethyl-2-thiouridine biosynthesis bifunctional protein
MSSQKLHPAQWEGSDDGRIFAPQFGDVYASQAGAWGQARAVFIDGCHLPVHWAQGVCVRLLETGFGLGVNFLATWATLESGGDAASMAGGGEGRRGRARLDYVSIEKHPFTRNDLRDALALSMAAAPVGQQARLQQLATRLLKQWPPMIPGFHTLELDECVTLTLVFDDIERALPQVRGRFDAIFLDGFAPDRNPAMWSASVLAQVAALAAPGARLSSWCVAGAVRRALSDAGFSVEKRPGYGGKRDCLSAQWPLSQVQVHASAGNSSAASVEVVADPVVVPAEAVVIGAGIAGASIARQLARRGVRVTVLDRDRAASGGSGNPVGVVRPEPGGAGNPVTELTAAGVTWLIRWVERYESLADHDRPLPHDWCGVLRIARDERKREKMAQQAGTADREWLASVALEEAARLCGTQPAEAGFHLPQAGWIVPPALVAAMLDHALIEVREGAEACTLRREGAHWQLALVDGSVLQSPLIVLATAFDPGLGPTRLGMGRARGQLSMLPAREGRPLNKVVCRDGYISPAVNGWHAVGATVQHDDGEGAARRADDEQNFERLQRLLPGFAGSAAELQSGRVGWRSTTPDRLPLVGKMEDGLYASLGHGARGVTCAPLLGEFLAAMICNEPLPLSAAWVARLDPLRRAVKGS